MTAHLLYLGTEDGLVTGRWDGESIHRVGHTLTGNAIRGIAHHPTNPRTAFIGSGLRGWGLYRTDDGGKSVEAVGFAEQWVWDVLFDPTDPHTLYVGTEPPALYVSRDAGDSFEQIEAIDSLPSRSAWTFFHAPFYAGHLHGIAIHPSDPDRIYVGVEHGALIYSHDRGATWREALVGYDLHRVTIDPQQPDRVLAGAGEGLFISVDAGETWEPVPDLLGKYVHGIEFDPHAPGRLYVYADDSESPLYRSDDRGETWHPLGESLPPASPADPLVVNPTESDTLLYAGDATEGSTLYESTTAGEAWHPIEAGLPKVWRLEVVTP